MSTKRKKNSAGPLTEHRILVFVPEHNSHGKRDVTGAFLPEAQKLLKLASDTMVYQGQPYLERCGTGSPGWASTGGRIVLFNNKQSMAKRRKDVLEALNEQAYGATLYTSVAFFCHGWLNGIQAGFTRRNVGDLAAAIYKATGSSVVPVPLFCCSTGDDPEDKPLQAAGTGDNSFADKLRDALCAQGANLCRVVGHTTVAHATSNPMVVFFDGMGTPDGGVGGYAPVAPRTANWKAWKRALRDRENNTLRLRMPYMSVAEIHKELS